MRRLAYGSSDRSPADGTRTRRVLVGDEALAPGRHELLLAVPGLGARVAATVLVGASRGPRTFLAGGLIPGDDLAQAVLRAIADRIPASELSGTLVGVPRGAVLGAPIDRSFPGDARGRPGQRLAHAVRVLLLEQAAFGIELRAGPEGWSTFPLARVDPASPEAVRLARALGTEAVIEAGAGPHSLRRAATKAGVPTVMLEGGELGRHDHEVVARLVTAVENVLRARGMLSGVPSRPRWRAIVGEVTKVRGATEASAIPLVAAGSMVLAGSPLAALFDATGRARGEILSPSRGLVLAIPSGGRPTRGAVARLGHVRASFRARAAAEAPGGERPTIGWCEWIALPELGVPHLHAKVDTGARTCALHVLSMRQIGEKDGRPVVELVLPIGRSVRRGATSVVHATIEEHVVVRDSGGHVERRPVIDTLLVLGPIRRRARITLTDRGDMLFPMLIGRTALGKDVVVDPTSRHRLGEAES